MLYISIFFDYHVLIESINIILSRGILMANPNKIRIIYHPAKKKVCFHVYEDEEEVHDRFEKLEKYSVDKEGKFVLSLVGREFFEDIIHVFPTKSSIDCSIKTTRLDYEEFKQKVDDFNSNFAEPNKECLIKLLELEAKDTLVEMPESFEAIKIQGYKINKLLDEYSLKIKNIECKSVHSKSYLIKISDQIDNESKKIAKSLKGFTDDNNVNICLIGVHSSGKSTLINTILGYKLLPVDIRPETAKMLKIKGVEKKDLSYIEFGTKEQHCRITWNVKSEKLKIADSDLSETLESEVIACIEDKSNLKLHEQIYNILDFLNSREELNACIDIGFPIPIDSENLKFTIYDTPGADSNVGYHKKILSEALSCQTNSILIFVLLPDSLSGTGNIELMQELLEKSNDYNNAIDIEQSFFVFNKADSSSDELDKLTMSKLKKAVDDKNPIDLCDRKMFFISSKLGYSAISVKNEIETEIEKSYLKYEGPKSLDDIHGKFYKHNHCGKSEYATNLMIQEAEKALLNSKSDSERYIISSGIFTLQNEIKHYGERYASAVKTSAIIKCIESVAESVRSVVSETQFGTNSEVRSKKDELDAEEEKVKNLISSTAQKYRSVSVKNEDLGVDSQSFVSGVLNQVEDVVNDRLVRFLRLSKYVHIDEQMQPAIQSDVKEIYLKYTNNYKEKRMKILEKTQKDFIDTFFKELNEDKNISREVKEQLKCFKTPKIPEFGLDSFIDILFQDAKLVKHEHIKKFVSVLANTTNIISDKLNQVVKNENDKSESDRDTKHIGKLANVITKKGIPIVEKGTAIILDKANDRVQILNDKIQNWNTRKLNKKEFINSVKDWCNENQGELTTKFMDDYKSALETMCEDLKTEFENNIDRYSTKVKALKEDNEPLEKLSCMIMELKKEFEVISSELEKKI